MTRRRKVSVWRLLPSEELAVDVIGLVQGHHYYNHHYLCVLFTFRYLGNVVSHPGEEKYCKIRLQNRVFQERVASVEGALRFLEAVGFQRQMLPHQGKWEERRERE